MPKKFLVGEENPKGDSSENFIGPSYKGLMMLATIQGLSI